MQCSRHWQEAIVSIRPGGTAAACEKAQARGSGIRRPETSFCFLAARTTMIGDDDRASGKLTTSGTGPPSRRIGLRKYGGKLNLFRIVTGISRKNALGRDVRSCRGRDVVDRNAGAPDDR